MNWEEMQPLNTIDNTVSSNKRGMRTEPLAHPQ